MFLHVFSEPLGWELRRCTDELAAFVLKEQMINGKIRKVTAFGPLGF